MFDGSVMVLRGNFSFEDDFHFFCPLVCPQLKKIIINVYNHQHNHDLDLVCLFDG